MNKSPSRNMTISRNQQFSNTVGGGQ
jgi:hypothetical protein